MYIYQLQRRVVNVSILWLFYSYKQARPLKLT